MQFIAKETIYDVRPLAPVTHCLKGTKLVLYCHVLHYVWLSSVMLFCPALFNTALHDAVLSYTVIYCTVLRCTLYVVLHCTMLSSSFIHCIALCCTALSCITLQSRQMVTVCSKKMTFTNWPNIFPNTGKTWAIDLFWTVTCPFHSTGLL